MLYYLYYIVLYYVVLYYIINMIGQRDELRNPHFKRQLRQEPYIKNKIFFPYFMTISIHLAIVV
jgi:hypothetical protein